VIAEAVIYSLLTGYAPLTNLVGTCIYFDTRPEDDPIPAVVYELISDKLDYTPNVNEPESRTARIQVTAFGSTAEQALSVREQVGPAAKNRSGQIAGYTVIDIDDGGSGADAYDHLVDIYSKPMDFIVHYLRPQP
jgi:hypothetical protein